MKPQVLLPLALVLCLQAVHTARILAILPFPGKGPFGVFKPILNKLAKKGHTLDVMSHFPLRKSVPRYNDISLEGTIETKTNNIDVKALQNSNFVKNMRMVFNLGGVEMCEAVLNSKQARDLLMSNKTYDLLLTHMASGDCMFGFGKVFNIPIVTITTTVNLPWGSDRMGLPDNPAYIPNYFSSFGPNMGFFERLWNTVMLLTTKASYSVHQEEIERISKRFFGNRISSIKEITKNVSLMMVNSHFSIQQPRPMVPNVVEIAGAHIEENFSIPKHLEEVMNSSSIIYLSFGSMVMTETLPDDMLEAMFESLKEVPYKVLWKADKDLFPKHVNVPSNVQFEKWMPQLAILCHPNTKLFISHGGMSGTQEANYCGVPILGIPIWSDQSLNINNNAAKGIAKEIKFDELTKQSFSEAVNCLLQPNYKNEAERISKIFKDRPYSASDTAVYWIEYVIRHNGAPHLKSNSVNLHWYQYYLLDILAFTLIIASISCGILYYSLKWLLVRLIPILINKKLKLQ